MSSLRSDDHAGHLRGLKSDVETLLGIILNEEVRLEDRQEERRNLTRRIVQAAKRLQFYFERKVEAGGDDAEYVPLEADALSDIAAMERELRSKTALLEKYDTLLKQWEQELGE